MHNTAWAIVALFPFMAALPAFCQASASSPQSIAPIAAAHGNAGGMAAVIGADVELGVALGRQSGLVVQCLLAKPDDCQAALEKIRAFRLSGTVSANVLEGNRLPYTNNLLNVIVVDSLDGLARIGPSEILRAVAPLGSVFVKAPQGTDAAAAVGKRLEATGLPATQVVRLDDGWLQIKKPWPADVDEWTHYLHGPDGNPVAHDRVVGPPRRYQWLAGPTYLRCHETDSSVSTLVTARGRLFYILDEAPISLVGDHPLPDKWFLVARDAFNGVLLWKVPIRRWGWREWKNTWFNARPGDIPLQIQKRLVATGDHVYVTLGYRAPVSQLDARTGELIRTYPETEGTSEILLSGGALIVSLPADDGGRRVAAFDTATGRRLWQSDRSYRGTTVDYIRWKEMYGGVTPVKLDPALNLACDAKLVAVIDGPELAGLDRATGRLRWRAAFPQDEAGQTPGGIQSQGNLWNGTLIVSGGVVVHASPSCLAAFSADTGKLLWSQPKKYIGHLWYEWKDVFVIDGLVWTWSAELERAEIPAGARKERATWPRSVNGYDLQTGRIVKSVALGNLFKANHHHRCYRNKATERYILASRRGTEFVDLEEGQHTLDNWIRGTCHVGMMPANGLQYAPPHPCACYADEKLNGFYAVAAETATPEKAVAPTDPRRLVQGPAFGQVTGQARPDDWPTFRADGRRSGAARTALPGSFDVSWRIAAGRRISPPVVAAGMVFVSLIDQHQVAAFDAATGRPRWQFPTAARVDSPPTYYEGALLFGSADGRVYCLRARDGVLAWRFTAAAASRWIGVEGQLESAWPVHGSVLVQNGTVYFTAGRTSHLDGGMDLYALEAASGKVAHHAHFEGPRYPVDQVQENVRLPMGTLPDVLAGDGQSIFLRAACYDAELKPCRGRGDLKVPGGYLDDTYFKRMPWTMDGNYARLIVYDEQSAYYVRMYDSLRGLDPSVFFTPGAKGYLLFAKKRGGMRNTWEQRVPVRVRAMVLAGGRLVTAGPPDVVDRQDPLGAFEGRKGGVLYVIDAATGTRDLELKLPSSPVFNGAAAAGGRLFLSAEDGSLSCLCESAAK